MVFPTVDRPSASVVVKSSRDTLTSLLPEHSYTHEREQGIHKSKLSTKASYSVAYRYIERQRDGGNSYVQYVLHSIVSPVNYAF